MTAINNLPDADYRKRKAIGATWAKLWLQSPQLLKDTLDGIAKRKESAAFDFGRAAHMLFLQPGLLAARLSDGPINDKTGKPYGADTQRFADWRATNPDAIVLSPKDRADIDHMSERQPAEIAAIWKNGKAEVSLFHEIAGCPACGRIDWTDGQIIYDLKTIGSMDNAERDMSRFGYWFQAAWYRMLWKQETGKLARFVFVFAERNPPYRWQQIEMDADWLMAADAAADRVVGEIGHAITTGQWPQHDSSLKVISRPAWDSDDDEETEDGE